MPCWDSTAEGVSHHCSLIFMWSLVFMRYRRCIAEMHFLGGGGGGYRTSTKTIQNGPPTKMKELGDGRGKGRGSHLLACFGDTTNHIARNRGWSLRYSHRGAQYGANMAIIGSISADIPSRLRKPWSANCELRGWQRGLSRQVSRAAWKRRINQAHKPWIREGLNSESGIFNLPNSSVSVHNVHFMVYAPLIPVALTVSLGSWLPAKTGEQQNKIQSTHRGIICFLVLPPFFVILSGLYGMENGWRPEMGKNGKANGKPPRAWQGQKWPKKGPKLDFSRNCPFFLHSLAIFAPVKLGAVCHSVFHFSPFPAFRQFSIPYRPGRIPILFLHSLSFSLSFP